VLGAVAGVPSLDPADAAQASILARGGAAPRPPGVDKKGNGYVAWDASNPGGADKVELCKIAFHRFCASRLTLALPPGEQGDPVDSVTEPFAVVGDTTGYVYVVGPRFAADDALVWVSSNGGASFGAPVVDPDSYGGDGTIDSVQLGPEPAPDPDADFVVLSNNPGLDYGIVPADPSANPVCPQSTCALSVQLSRSTVQSAALGFYIHQTVVAAAFGTAPSTTVRCTWSSSPRDLSVRMWSAVGATDAGSRGSTCRWPRWRLPPRARRCICG
jgi:hypothetical protein